MLSRLSRLVPTPPLLITTTNHQISNPKETISKFKSSGDHMTYPGRADLVAE